MSDDCPEQLLSFWSDIDLVNNAIDTDEIKNGHLLSMCFCMSGTKSLIFQKFYEILKSSDFFNDGPIVNYSKAYSRCYNLYSKYNTFWKKGKIGSTSYYEFVKTPFTFVPKSPEDIKQEFVALEKPHLTENKNGKVEKNNIYEQYFDILSEDLDANTKNEKLSSLMEEAMSKIHDGEVSNHKLNITITKLKDEIKRKNETIEELSKQTKYLKQENKTPNIPKSSTASKSPAVSKTPAVSLSKSPPIKRRRRSSKPVKPKQKSHPIDPSKEQYRKDLEEKILILLTEKNSSKISEKLLETFPDMSIADFEIILKILTDSNALINQKITHKWNVEGEDVLYHGIIIGNVSKEKQFKIRYWEDLNFKDLSEDIEIVEHNSLITDIILKDLTFNDPGSLI